MRRALLLVVALAALASGGETAAIHVYRRGKVLGYDKDVGASLNEALIETWSCETGELQKTERIETYFHLSEDGEVLTPRALCDRCRERFELEKTGTKTIFKGKKKPPPPAPKSDAVNPPKPPVVAPVATPSRAALDADALAELEKKACLAASEIKKIDPREAGSATKRRRIIEDRGLQVAFNEWPDDAKAAQAIAKAIETKGELGAADRYYVLRSFGWQRWHEHDATAAAVFYDRCIHLEPRWSSAHYGLALVKRDRKDDEGELLELAWALRVKPTKAKYAKLLLERMGAMKTPVGKLDAKALEDLKAGAGLAQAKLEQSPPDLSAAKAAIEDTIGKVLDARAPLDKKAASTPEPDEGP